MTNVSEWSPTAGLNNSSPPDGFPEGMARSAVNDACRELMAALARWYQDSNATNVTTGGTANYSLTTSSGYAALGDIPLLVFRVNVSNTAAVTLNVDNLGAKPWRKSAALENFQAGELVAGQICVVAYSSVDDDFIQVGPSHREQIPVGTSMVFYNASVPTGWTAVALNNRALRVVTSGTTGGSVGGTTAFTSVFTSRTISQANLPAVDFPLYSTIAASHAHTVTSTGATDSQGAHTHSYGNAGSSLNVDQPGGAPVADTSSGTTGSSGTHAHNVTVSGTTSASGSLSVSGQAWSDGSGTAMDFAVQYIDVCVGTKT